MNKSIAALVVFLFLWTGYFYGIDWLIMSGQGLPVGADLMPAQ